VKAIDTAGNIDPTPATFTWTVDTTPPDTIIDSGPASPTNSTNATFNFHASETSTFQCQLDGGGFTACTSPKSYSGLASGIDHTFQVRATDTSGNTDPTPANYTWHINAAPVVSSSPGTQNVQYSDSIATVTISATDEDSVLIDGSISVVGLPAGISLNPGTCNPVNGGSTCTWTVSGNVLASQGIYNVAVTVTDDVGASGTTSFTIEVSKEDARVTYTGTTFASTSCSTCSTATVTLAATIQDITAVTGDPAYDPNAGDIRNATVTFVNRDDGDSFLCLASVGLVNLSDTKTGTATCNWTANIGSNDSVQFTVGIIVNNYYTRNTSEDDEIVTVSKPIATNFITGGGYLINQASAGMYPGDKAKKTNFGFNVKYNKGGKNLQGNINTIIRNNGRVYQIKGNAMTSLSVNPQTCSNATPTSLCTAVFNGKANIKDITDPLNVISIDGNGTLQVNMTDRGEPGKADTIGITLWDKNGGLWFSSNWNGVKTVEQTLGGGNLVVH
jgi:hypothetical protein